MSNSYAQSSLTCQKCNAINNFSRNKIYADGGPPWTIAGELASLPADHRSRDHVMGGREAGAIPKPNLS